MNTTFTIALLIFLYLMIGNYEANFVARKFFEGHLELTHYLLIVLLWPATLVLLALFSIAAIFIVITKAIIRRNDDIR